MDEGDVRWGSDMEDVPLVILGRGASPVEEVLGWPTVVHMGNIPNKRSGEGHGEYHDFTYGHLCPIRHKPRQMDESGSDLLVSRVWRRKCSRLTLESVYTRGSHCISITNFMILRDTRVE